MTLEQFDFAEAFRDLEEIDALPLARLDDAERCGREALRGWQVMPRLSVMGDFLV